MKILLLETKKAVFPVWKINLSDVRKNPEVHLSWGVLSYGEPVKEKGLNLLSAPGNDLVASTAPLLHPVHTLYFLPPDAEHHLQVLYLQ